MTSQFSGDSFADLSYSSYPTEITSIPPGVFQSIKFDSRNSPISPFSTHFDIQNLTPYNDTTQDQQQSSTNSFTETTPSNSSLNNNEDYFLDSTNRIKHALMELESALMSPDDDDDNATNSINRGRSSTPGAWNQETTSESHSPQDSTFPREAFVMQGVPPYNLKQLLIMCAKALSENNLGEFHKLIELARASVSITGEPIQRLGAYMLEGLIAREELSGTNIYRSLKCNEPTSKDLLSYMHILYDICPYLKFGYMAANGAIAEALKNENQIHIIDFQIAQGTQWMTLLQALAARPGGPPHVRITGIDDPMSKYARGAGLAAVEARLAEISRKFNIPVEFNAHPVYAPDVTRAGLDLRPGEALAVNFPLQLHHTPDESVDVSNPRDGLLRMVKSLSPKVVTLVEQESNTNTAPFLPRFIEALDYYSAMFESIDITMGRDVKERISVEEQCLARDIVNIIACEGKERVERHELLGKWRLRFMMAGFRQFPLSSYVNSVIGGLLRSYSEHYTLVEKDGGLLLGWKERNLVSASAWH